MRTGWLAVHYPLSKTRACEWVLKTQKHMQMWYILSEPKGMSIIIINSRNPRRNSSSALCSLLRTRPWMMRAALLCFQWAAAAEAGLIFVCSLHVSFPSVVPDNVQMERTRSSFSVIGNVKPGVDPERSDYRMLRAERGTCSRSTPGFDHIPLSRRNTPRLSLI